LFVVVECLDTGFCCTGEFTTSDTVTSVFTSLASFTTGVSLDSQVAEPSGDLLCGT
jgi:hypothetical protein